MTDAGWLAPERGVAQLRSREHLVYVLTCIADELIECKAFVVAIGLACSLPRRRDAHLQYLRQPARMDRKSW